MDKCPHCGGALRYDDDEWEKFVTCSACAREFKMNLIPIRMNPFEFTNFYRIKLPLGTNDGKMDIV